MAGKQKKLLRELVIDAQQSVSEFGEHANAIGSVVRNAESGKVLLPDERGSLLRLVKWLDVHKNQALATLAELAQRMPDDSIETSMEDTQDIPPIAATVSESENPDTTS